MRSRLTVKCEGSSRHPHGSGRVAESAAAATTKAFLWNLDATPSMLRPLNFRHVGYLID